MTEWKIPIWLKPNPYFAHLLWKLAENIILDENKPYDPQTAAISDFEIPLRHVPSVKT